MFDRDDYKQIVSILGETSDDNRVYEALERLTFVLGFDRFAISHHVVLIATEM